MTSTSVANGPGATRRAGTRSRGGVAALLVAMSVGALLSPASVAASTATTTTLDVPADTQYGAVTVTAHVRPAPQPADGFSPAALFLIDGGGGVPSGPLDANGDATTELSLSVGTHTIVASFGPFSDWAASQSDPASVTVGIATQTGLTSSRNPATTQQVTITASVTPGTVTGGTLSIVDALDGSTIASAEVSAGSASVSVSRLFAEGDHPLTATYSGDGDYGPSTAHLTQTVQPDIAVDGTAGVQYPAFYPYHDGYRDTELIRGTLHEPASVLIRVYSSSNALIRTVDLGARPAGQYSDTWTGRDGGRDPAGRDLQGDPAPDGRREQRQDRDVVRHAVDEEAGVDDVDHHAQRVAVHGQRR